MKQLFLFGALAAAIFAGSGCKKLLTYSEEHGVPYIVPNSNIASIVFGNFSGPDTVVFTYNAAGNPVSAIMGQTSTGMPDFLMRYDANGKMTDLIGTYSPDINTSGLESWNKYYYNAAGDIVTDTAIAFPTIVNGQPTVGIYGLLIVAKYSYDTKHRLIQDSDWVVGSGAYRSRYFSYDSSGNMVGVGHDNKVNYFRTNKYWQFLNQDYSVNNPVSASYTYNNAGLPVTVSGGGYFLINPVDQMMSMASSAIHYQ